MKISHRIISESGKDIVYIYIKVQDIYEFGKENLGKGSNTDFLTKLRKYINNNLQEFKKSAAIIVINGVIIGSLSLATIYSNTKLTSNTPENIASQVQVYREDNILEEKKVNTVIQEEKIIEENENKLQINDSIREVENVNSINTSIETNTTNTTNITNTKNTKKVINTTNNKLKDVPNTNIKTSENKQIIAKSTTNKEVLNSNDHQDNTTTMDNKLDSNSDINISETKSDNSETKNETTEVSNGIKVTLNNGGVISQIDLEEYVIGVVSAEMPASFHSEALKAQAVVARTYAMKKSSKGITLVNSTSNQVYYTKEQMQANWGSSYTTYYNKVKNAVNATKGQVLKYNGAYIEALYFSMSNGKTELPSYVWNYNYPYLQVVSSSWDENISAAKYTISVEYEKIYSKLGVKVDENSEIKILSKTPGDRVNEVSIAGKIFTGVKLRSLLGLRSTDFTITQTNTGVNITTIGFGHGVGMSQYGANGAAKEGYTYKQILSHYYSGASLVSI